MSSADEFLPPGGNMYLQAYEKLVTTLNERGIKYAIIGGLALIEHTRVRTTVDIDVLLTVPQLAMPGLFESLKETGFNIDIHRNIREFREQEMTVIRFGDVNIDLMRPLIPAHVHVLDRVIDADIFGQKVRICSAEGLIVLKLIAMRPQDEADIQELFRVYGGKLDLDFIRTELETFTMPDESRRLKFEAWVKQYIPAD